MRRAHLVHLLLLTAVGYILFFHHLGQRDLWSSHEARAAQDATSILKQGHWLIPTLFDGRQELQKPPLYYWLVAGFSWPLGEVNETTARLPAALGAWLTLLAVYAAAAYRGRPGLGLLAALLLATFVRFTWLARVGRIDMPLTAAISVALLSLWLSREEQQDGRRRRSVGFACLAWLATAVAVMLKGPIGYVLPCVVGAAAALVDLVRNWRRGTWPPEEIYSLKPWLLTLALTAPLALGPLPWYFAANTATKGQFFDEFLWKHNFQRGLGGDDQLDGHDHPFWFYSAQLWLDAAPWSFIFAGAWALRRCSRVVHAESAGASLADFGLVWFLAMFVFFSLMRYKRPDYLLPAYPGLALFLAGTAARWANELTAAGQRRAALGFGVLVAGCAAGWVGYVDLYLPPREAARSLRTFAALVRRQAGSDPVLLFRVDNHLLNWHLGPPAGRVWEWENLDIWAAADQPRFIVTTPEWSAVWENHLEAGRLRPALTTTEAAGTPHETPLVFMLSEPAARSGSVR